jgi:twitching motility two-component system response regulator PilH
MPNALVIDDNRLAADILCKMLDVLDVSAQVALGPRAALQVLGTFKPDILFLDLNMPGINGLEVLRYLKRDPAFINIPVVVVTSDDQPQTAAEARKDGALDLIVKPATIEALQVVLQQAGIK